MKLTESIVRKLPFEPGRQRVIRDDDLASFFVVIGKTTRTYTIQQDLRQGGRRVKTVRMAIGKVGEITLKQARIEARATLGQISRGIDPTQPNGAGLTLRAAWERYQKHLAANDRSGTTIKLYTYAIERLLKDWLDRPMVLIGNDLEGVHKRHERITRVNGKAIANSTMRVLRAVYRFARKRIDRSLPEHPVEAVTFHKERRRSTALRPDQMPAWEAQRQALGNPIRREVHLFILLSGMRPGATMAARWEHLDVKRRILHVPRPKGGEDRAFDLPLSRALLRCLWRAREAGRIMHPKQAKVWIFPASSASGHVAIIDEPRSALSHWGGDLRQTWRTISEICGVPETARKAMLNHAFEANPHDGYFSAGSALDFMVMQQERISRHILGLLRAHPGV